MPDEPPDRAGDPGNEYNAGTSEQPEEYRSYVGRKQIPNANIQSFNIKTKVRVNKPAESWVYIVTEARLFGSVWKYKLKNETTNQPYESGTWVEEENLDELED